MAYTDDAVLAKLSALNETQESIVTVAQWVMFHRYEAQTKHPSVTGCIILTQQTGDMQIERASCGFSVSKTQIATRG